MNAGSMEFVIEAVTREDEGRGASRRLRRQGRIPAVVYGAGKDAVSVTLNHDDLLHASEHEAFYASILKLKVDGGRAQDVLLKDMQRHPFKPKLVHIDFQRVRSDVAIKVHVPLHVEGADVAPGAKEGGVVQHLASEVEVSCLPKDLPESLTIDVSELALDASAHLSDIKLPEGVELTALTAEEPNDLPIVSIHVQKEVPEEEPEAEAAAEGEATDSAEGSEEPKADDADKKEGEE